ncbi:MAG: ubiquinol-cytochrome c reductase iron-sulfur subunit [Candidatus Tectimicrobiota bacterium]
MQDNADPSGDVPGASSSPAHTGLRRRQVTRLGWIAAALVFFGSQIWILLKLVFTPPAPGQSRGQFGLGALAQFPLGSVTHFRKERLFLVHTATGLLALADECTHQQCPLLYVSERQLLQCNCHGAQFSPAGEVLGGPAPRPLPRYAVTIQDDQVLVDTSRVIDRRAS